MTPPYLIHSSPVGNMNPLFLVIRNMLAAWCVLAVSRTLI